MNWFNTKSALMLAGLLTISAPGVCAEEITIIGKHIHGLILDADQDPLIRQDRAEIHPQASVRTELVTESSTLTAEAFSHPVGAIYLVRRDGDNTINTVPVDAHTINGVSQPEIGLPTAWGSVLYSEAMLVDAADATDFISAFKPYFKGDAGQVNPYDYGWPVEMVVLDDKGHGKLVKNYAMGRVAAKDIQIMPDQKTVWMLSGDGSGYLYVFIAEDARNFSKGRLLVVDLSSDEARWIEVANTSSLKAKFRLKRVQFDKLLAYDTPSEQGCADALTLTETVYGRECLRITDKRNAGLFEPHRFAALAGVDPQFASFVDIEYDDKQNELVLKAKSGRSQRFVLGAVEQMHSDFLIKERL